MIRNPKIKLTQEEQIIVTKSLINPPQPNVELKKALIESQNAMYEIIDNKSNTSSNEDVFFKLKQLEGDKSISLGQSILALIALNKSSAYSKEMNHCFNVKLFASLIQELNITPEEIKTELDNRNNTDK